MTTFSNVAVEPRLSEKDYLFIKRLEMEHNLMVVETFVVGKRSSEEKRMLRTK